MFDKLSWTQIADRYPSRWVLVTDIDLIDGLARVVSVHDSQADASSEIDDAFDAHKELGCVWTGAPI